MAKSGLKSLSWIVKVILVIFYDIYGILRRLTSGKPLPIIIGLLQIFTVNFAGIMWLIDLITVIFKNDATVLS